MLPCLLMKKWKLSKGAVIWPNCIGRKNGADMWTWTWWPSPCSFCYITSDRNKIFGYLVCLLPLMTSPKCRSFIMSPDIRKIELYVTGIVIKGHDPPYHSLNARSSADTRSWVIRARNTPQVEWELTAKEKSRWETRVYSVARARELSQIQASQSRKGLPLDTPSRPFHFLSFSLGIGAQATFYCLDMVSIKRIWFLLRVANNWRVYFFARKEESRQVQSMQGAVRLLTVWFESLEFHEISLLPFYRLRSKNE